MTFICELNSPLNTNAKKKKMETKVTIIISKWNSRRKKSIEWDSG